MHVLKGQLFIAGRAVITIEYLIDTHGTVPYNAAR